MMNISSTRLFAWFTVFLLGSASILEADPPAWWTTEDTTIIDPNASHDASDNYAPANQGQLKNVAEKAALYLNYTLPSPGAGSAINDMVNAFQHAYSDYSPINLGQLKAVAKPFYERLNIIGYDTRKHLIHRGYPSNWPYQYPWNPNTPASDNYKIANIGQLKMAFSFSLEGFTTDSSGNINDSDGDLMDDGFEELYYGSSSMDPNADDDNDGVSNLDEFIAGTNPEAPPDTTPQYTPVYFYCYTGASYSYSTQSAQSTSSEPDYSSPTISWDISEAQGVSSFIVERCETPIQDSTGTIQSLGNAVSWTQVHQGSAGETSWQDSGLKADKSYAYRVWAVLAGFTFKVGPTEPSTYTVPLNLEILGDKVSKSKTKYGFPEYITNPIKRYLKQTVTWTGLQGGSPESPPLDVGSGSSITTYNADTGVTTNTHTGIGNYGPTGSITSPTTKSGTVTISSYDDPPNEEDDTPGTQTITTELTEENTTSNVIQKAIDGLPAFSGNYDSYWPSAQFYVSDNETSVTVEKLKYKLNFSSVGNSTIKWIERFHPQGDYDNYTDTEKSWTGSGTETPVYTIDATSGAHGTYEILQNYTYVDLMLQGGSEATEESPGAILFVNRDNDEGRWASNTEGDYDSYYTPDKDLSTAYYDDDLKWLYLGYSPDEYDEGTVKLEIVSGGDKIKVWEDWNKGQVITLPKQWNLANEETPPWDYYIEGIKASTSAGDVVLKLSYTNKGRTFSDTIKVTVVSPNFGLVVYRNQEWMGDLEHAGVVTDYVGAMDLDSLNNPSNWIVTESAGAKAGDDRDVNPNSTMRRIPLATFIANGTPAGNWTGAEGPAYERGYSVDGITDETRNHIVDLVNRIYARRNTIIYGLLGVVAPQQGMNVWNGSIEIIWKIRCDGVPEVAYELSGVNVWGFRLGSPGSYTYHYPIQTYPQDHQHISAFNIDPYTQLSPKSQRGGFGNNNTYMKRYPFFEPKSLITEPALKDTAP